MTQRLLIGLAIVCAVSQSVTAQTTYHTRLVLSGFPFISGTSDTTLATVSQTQIPTSKVLKSYTDRRLGGRPLATTAPATGQVIGWDGATWKPVTVSGGGGSGTVNVTARLTGDGSVGSPLDIAQQGAGAGQVLQWNGTVWLPASVAVSKTYQEIEGVTGLEITSSNPFPSVERNWRINLYRDGLRLRYLKDYSISGSTITLYVPALAENFTLIIEN